MLQNHPIILRFLHLTLCLFICSHLFAHQDLKYPPMVEDSSKIHYYIIGGIDISGNKQTKKHIIFRELDFAIGDTLEGAKLEEIIEENRNQVYNTRLFNDVKIGVEKRDSIFVFLEITVEERWYVFPVPIFELTDRNFNVWWNEFNRDLSRTEYGIRFYHYNFRGRREQLKATAQFGFTKKYELEYKIPFIDKAHKIGTYYKVSYILNRELSYRHIDNGQEFYKHQDGFARKRFGMSIGASLRSDIHHSHQVFLDFNRNSIVDTLAQMNPDYFLEGRTQQSFLRLVYSYVREQRDIVAYPLKGDYLNLHFTRTGLGIFGDVNMTALIAHYSNHFPMGGRFYGLGNVKAKLSIPDQQPFYNQRGLGFGVDYLRGYEYYVIDGQSYLMLRTAFKYELVKTKIRNPLLKSDQFRTLPLAIYLKTYGELGYVKDDYYSATNPLANQWLSSAGVGVDIFTVYDMVASLEYTRNGLNQWGFYVSFGLNYGR